MPDTPPESGVNVPPAEQAARAELRERYAEALRHLWQEPDCPICRSNRWNIGDLVQAPLRVVAPPASTARDVFIETFKGSWTSRLSDFPHVQGIDLPQVYLYLPVTCLVCGYTLFFNSGVLDIRDAQIKTGQALPLPPR